MQTEASQHSRSSSGFESLDGVASAKGDETNEPGAFNTKAAPKSANAPVTVSTVSFPSSTGLSQRSKDSYIGATTITVAIRSKTTVHMRVLATAKAYDKSANPTSPVDIRERADDTRLELATDSVEHRGCRTLRAVCEGFA